MSSSKVLSRGEIEHRIALGDAIVIFENSVLRMNKWLKFHPGGDKAVFHLVGRDATDEMIAYHCDETQATFKRWKIGEINYKWINFVPPIQGGKFRTLEEQELDEIKEEQLSRSPASPASNSSSSEDLKLSSSTDPSDVEDSIDTKAESSSNYAKQQQQKQQQPKLNTTAGQCSEVTKPKIPQGLIPSLSTKEAYERKVVKDPSDVIDNYDNGQVEQDLKSLPSLDYETQEHLSKEYNKLHDIIIENGWYQCPYWEYAKEATRIATLFSISFTLLYFKWYFLSAIFLGLAWQQLVFIAHDAGHISITHQYETDNIIGMIVASFIGGLSLGWWKRNHNVHHLITNDPVHDPDIQHLPFFAVSTRLFGNVYSTYYEKFLWFDAFAKKLIPIQQFMYYPILSFGRFNLYRLSWEHVLFGQGPRHGKAAWFRYFELVGLTFFNWWFFYLIVYKSIESNSSRFMFVMVSHITTMIVHVQITLSHFAMSTSDLGTSESFVSRQIRTTMDVDCPGWFDFFHGGLQFQAIHHLFPRVPRHNFRKIQPLVIGFCDKVGLKYSIYGFVDGNEVVINKLSDIAKQAKIMRDCHKTMKKEAIEEGKYFEF
ncbi:sphingolipid delta8-desaturase [Wickerhamomyces ciferrii]|uniref:Delta 8-(E)-sphingolipid desaturase n=2 Tax=Wickerhamomyces ciferrii TaxID=1041607 RepID=K0KAG5_WICCF|nr:sphingolipid delta8-desaturase [Wickerhamomyces ciferrii]ADW79426.1 sphingolipid delta8-desaturase [Wickerhamomyces ciferrii]CCH41965.1 sphingolipid delta8-desaturase [Wickerhamomyces ciferrii]